MLSGAVILSFLALAQPPSPPPAPAAGPRRLALLIGINEYKSPEIADLKGCVNDVQRMRAVLTSKFGFRNEDVTVLEDGQATRAAIFATFRRVLIDQAKPGDAVVLHYSGHGSRMKDAVDASRDEADGFDETIVPHDGRLPGIFDITDDELNGLLRELSQKTSNITFVLDSCHSGSAVRGGAQTRRIPDDTRDAPPPTAQAWAPRGIGHGQGDLRLRDSRYVLIAGCRPQQLSNEFDRDGRRMGALTYFLTRALEESPNATYREIMDTVRDEVRNEFPSQEPEIEGAAADDLLFRGETRAAPAYVVVSPLAARTAAVGAGAAHGLVAGSTMDVYAPGATSMERTEDRIARLRLTKVEPFRSEADVIEGRVKAGSRAALREHSYADFKLGVCYPDGAPTGVLRAVQAELATYPFLQAVTDQHACDLRLTSDGTAITLASGDLTPRSPAVRLDEPSAAKHVVNQVLRWAQWEGVRRLDNPAPTVAARLIVGGGEGVPRTFAPGSKVDIAVENLSRVPLYPLLLDLSTDGSIEVVYPEQGQPAEVVPPNSRRTIGQVEFNVPDDREAVTDTLKLFATSTELDGGVFAQSPVRGVEARPAGDDPLAALIQGNVLGRTRSARRVPLAGWTTVQETVTIARNAVPAPAPSPLPSAAPAGEAPRADDPPPSSLGFVFHVAPGATRGVDEGIRSVLPACPGGATEAGDACWDLVSLGGDGSAWEAVPRQRGASRGSTSVGAAWDAAYRIRNTTGMERVEPDLEVDRSDQGYEDEPPSRSGKQRPDKDGAKNDPEWSLTHIRAFAAWDRLRQEGGAEGKGVVIAHPDTGYREHRELWDADENKSSLLYSQGYDFFDEDANPFDELDTGGLVPNPGHGTKSGSVIVSPRGKQWAGGGERDFVTGVAPGARLIPLRVHRSVVHFFPGRLAKAIQNAAGPDRSLVKTEPQVISISMGGVPSWGLWKAVKYAEKRGVIVVAAAGNEVGTVVWPARFDQTIAVAASNVDCGTWEGSSRGGAVDIAAPGESVWRAATDPGGMDSVGMGQGTTFATATTAGVAALWIDYMRVKKPALLAELKRTGRVTDAFREALRKTAWRPEMPPEKRPPGVTCKNAGPWDTKKYGAGIVDALGALTADVEIRDLPPRGDADDSLADLPLFTSLFDEAYEEDAEERFRGLVRLAPGTPTESAAELEGEIVHHYATDEATRAAFKGLLESRTPDEAAYQAARDALLQRDISSRLREALRGR